MHDFLYVSCDIPPGMTLADHRRARSAPQRRPRLLTRLRALFR
jgi:hypothetical protein